VSARGSDSALREPGVLLADGDATSREDGVVPSRPSDVELLVLHAVRLRGVTTAIAAAQRFGLDLAVVEDLLLDFAAYGWVRHSEFAGAGSWSLTDSGRAEGEKRLLAELQDSGGRAAVEDVHKRFLPLNASFQAEVTKWQIRPLAGDELACNDHNRLRWDDRVLDSLERTIGHARALCESVSGVLQRFDGTTYVWVVRWLL
jgi:hypothetical protein